MHRVNFQLASLSSGAFRGFIDISPEGDLNIRRDDILSARIIEEKIVRVFTAEESANFIKKFSSQLIERGSSKEILRRMSILVNKLVFKKLFRIEDIFLFHKKYAESIDGNNPNEFLLMFKSFNLKDRKAFCFIFGERLKSLSEKEKLDLLVLIIAQFKKANLKEALMIFECCEVANEDDRFYLSILMAQKDPVLISKNIRIFNMTGEFNRDEILKKAIAIAINPEYHTLYFNNSDIRSLKIRAELLVIISMKTREDIMEWSPDAFDCFAPYKCEAIAYVVRAIYDFDLTFSGDFINKFASLEFEKQAVLKLGVSAAFSDYL